MSPSFSYHKRLAIIYAWRSPKWIIDGLLLNSKSRKPAMRCSLFLPLFPFLFFLFSFFRGGGGGGLEKAKAKEKGVRVRVRLKKRRPKEKGLGLGLG